MGSWLRLCLQAHPQIDRQWLTGILGRRPDHRVVKDHGLSRQHLFTPLQVVRLHHPVLQLLQFKTKLRRLKLLPTQSGRSHVDKI